MARQYRQERRRDAAALMRERIVQATFELHGEQGIVGTTMKQIAERAGVSVGSVYHHFRTYDEAIEACGAHALALAPPPSHELFDGVEDRAERIRRLARALFEQFERIPAFGFVVAEREQVASLKRFTDAERATRLALAAAALGEPEGAEAPTTLAALLDHGVYRALRDVGLDAGAAASRAAEIAIAWLACREP